MSSATTVRYTVEQLAAMREATEVAQEKSRLRVIEERAKELRQEIAVVSEAHGTQVAFPAGFDTSDRGNSETLRARANAAQEQLDALAEEIRTARAESRNARLAEQLKTLALDADLSDLSDDTPRPAAAAASAARARAIDFAAEIDSTITLLDPDAELPEELVRRAARLRTATGTERERMALKGFTLDVAALNEAARRLRTARARLEELDARAGALGPDGTEAAALVLGARAEANAGRVPDLSGAEAAIEEAEEGARQRADDARAREILTEAMASLGYGVEPGFETAIPEGGMLVSKPSWNEHAVQFTVADGEIRSKVLRTAHASDSARAATDDTKAEEAFCKDFDVLVDKMSAGGISSDVYRRIEPGILPVDVIHGARAAATATKRAASRAREAGGN